MLFLGELAAVGTALCWGSSASLFVTSGRRMGSLVLNRLRLTTALLFLAVTLWAVRGAPWPIWATREQLQLLALSSLLGFVLGDSLYFRALVILGAGPAALLMSMSPVFAALQARLFLHERRGLVGLVGMTMTLAGPVLALRERSGEGAHHPEGSVLVGIVSGAAAALFSSVGYVLSRAALQDGIDALSATVIRVSAAVPLVWLLAPLHGGFRRSLHALRDRVALRSMLGATFLGPFLGVTLSLLALQHTEVGVATSIFSCFPLLALFLGARVHGERVTLRMMLGALVSVAGIVVLFSRPAAAVPDPCDDPDADVACCFSQVPDSLTPVMAIADSSEVGERLVLTGVVYQADGTSPYAGVLLYAYHTDHSGVYSDRGDERGIQSWHGHLHGWCKTDSSGHYEIRSIRPGRYPSNAVPAHIHAALREPDGRTYWINDFVFADDDLVGETYVSSLTNPGGTGVVTLERGADGVLRGGRDIVVPSAGESR